eukprot:753285-Hanusia_phi.AAC.8
MAPAWLAFVFPKATSAEAMDPRVTDMESQLRKVLSLARNVLGSTRVILFGGSIGAQHAQTSSNEAICVEKSAH